MEKGLVLKLRLFMLFIAAASTAFGPFLPVYFSSRKLTFAQMGFLFALSAIMGVILQPIWGYISDKYLNKKKTLIITLVFSMLVAIFFIKAESFEMILMLIIANNIFLCSLNPILDAYIFDIAESSDSLNYSSFRFISSAAWGISNLILGYAIKDHGIEWAFIIYEILTVTGVLILFTIKFEGNKIEHRIEFHDVGLIFKDKRMVLFFLTVFLMNAAFLGGTNFMNELVKFTHGDVSKLGMVWFLTCIFEVITFFFAVRIIEYSGILKVYLISIIIYGTKFILDYFFNSANYIIAVQVLEGIAFTLFLTSSINFLNDNTDARIRSTSMSFYAAAGGFGAFASSLLGGLLLNVINPSQLYGIFGLLCFASFAIGLALLPKEK